jgi:hypothetical protein
VTIPERANVSITGATANGSIDASFTLPLTTTPHRGRRWTFKLGTGSARLEVESFQGDIELRRPGEIERRQRDKDKDGRHDSDHDYNFDLNFDLKGATSYASRYASRYAKEYAPRYAKMYARMYSRSFVKPVVQPVIRPEIRIH